MTKHRLYSFVIAGLCASLAACTNAPPPKPSGKQLSAAEVASLYLSGEPVTNSGTSIDSGRKWEITRDGNGNQSIVVAGSGYQDSGTYRIDGNQLCSKWKEIRDGAENCVTYYVLPDGSYEAADASGAKTATFVVQSPS